MSTSTAKNQESLPVKYDHPQTDGDEDQMTLHSKDNPNTVVQNSLETYGINFQINTIDLKNLIKIYKKFIDEKSPILKDQNIELNIIYNSSLSIYYLNSQLYNSRIGFLSIKNPIILNKNFVNYWQNFKINILAKEFFLIEYKIKKLSIKELTIYTAENGHPQAKVMRSKPLNDKEQRLEKELILKTSKLGKINLKLFYNNILFPKNNNEIILTIIDNELIKKLKACFIQNKNKILLILQPKIGFSQKIKSSEGLEVNTKCGYPFELVVYQKLDSNIYYSYKIFDIEFSFLNTQNDFDYIYGLEIEQINIISSFQIDRINFTKDTIEFIEKDLNIIKLKNQFRNLNIYKQNQLHNYLNNSKNVIKHFSCLIEKKELFDALNWHYNKDLQKVIVLEWYQKIFKIYQFDTNQNFANINPQNIYINNDFKFNLANTVIENLNDLIKTNNLNLNIYICNIENQKIKILEFEYKDQKNIEYSFLIYESIIL